MDADSKLCSFTDRDFYTAHFMDAVLWKPFVQRVCRTHGYESSKLWPGLAGTYPTFIVEVKAYGVHRSTCKIVVKFFGPPFNGTQAYEVERNLGYWLEQQPLPVHSPAILAGGLLEPDWWYLVFEHIPGTSIGKARQQLSESDWGDLLPQVGEFMRSLHAKGTPRFPDQPEMLSPTWDRYAGFLSHQRLHCLVSHQAWKDLPQHLLDQIESFIPPVEQIVDFSIPPHLIHADLTADHLLGKIMDGRWQTMAIIDWGDAMTGDILYEIIAPHFDLWRGNPRWLTACLDAYQLPDFYRQDFPRKALSMALLQLYPLPAWIIQSHSDTRTLPELAQSLFAY